MFFTYHTTGHTQILVLVSGWSSEPKLEHSLEIVKSRALESQIWKLQFFSCDTEKRQTQVKEIFGSFWLENLKCWQNFKLYITSRLPQYILSRIFFQATFRAKNVTYQKFGIICRRKNINFSSHKRLEVQIKLILRIHKLLIKVCCVYGTCSMDFQACKKRK